MSWFDDLLDECIITQGTGDRAASRLVRLFADIDQAVMQTAVDDYILHNKFFPRISELKPYVDVALENARGQVAYRDLVQQVRYSDDDILAWEQERGTMPADELFDTEWLPCHDHITTLDRSGTASRPSGDGVGEWEL